MNRVATSTPDLISFRQPAGLGVMIGLPMLLALGAVTAIFAVRFSHSLQRTDSPVLWIIVGAYLLFMVLLLVARAGDLVRIAVTVDRLARTVTPAKGFIFPLDGKSLSLEAFDKLIIDSVLIKHTRTYEHYYTLSLATPNGSLVRIGRNSNYQPIRNMAEDIGQFIQMGVLDAHMTPPTYLPPESLGRSLADQSDAASTPTGVMRNLRKLLPPPPPNMRTQWSVDRDTLVLELPPKGYGCFIAVFILFAAATSGAAYCIFVSHIPPSVFAIFGGVLALVVMILYGGNHPVHTKIEVNRNEIRVAWKGFIFTSTRVIEAQQLREMRLKARVLELYSREGSITFARGDWQPAEVQWIEQAVRCALSG